MSRKKRPRNFECTYCGSNQNPSDDHIPAECIFPEGQQGLIKVPSCEKCNRRFAKDDEYFRNMILMRQDVADHPVAQVLLPKVRRAYARAEGRGRLVSLVNNLRRVPLRTHSGRYAGQGNLYHIDSDRLDRVVARIIRGLYFHETETRLP